MTQQGAPWMTQQEAPQMTHGREYHDPYPQTITSALPLSCLSEVCGNNVETKNRKDRFISQVREPVNAV